LVVVWQFWIDVDVTESLTWIGLGDIINKFRSGKGLHKLPINVAPRLLHSKRVPHTYCWSPHLIPKPSDWGHHIDVVGFFHLNLAQSYTPPDDLLEFLRKGTKPIYIGFGSIVVDNPEQLTRLIFEAISLSGCRAIVSKGWGGLGSNAAVPENIYLIGNCPHDWLFDQVSAVVHHGGAGTTATGLLKGKPTVIVPFFGDQPFWGSMVAKQKCGPVPIPFKDLSARKLAEAIRFSLQEEIALNCAQLGIEMNRENGVKLGVQSFHRQLSVKSMACDIVPSLVAAYYVKESNMQISRFVAEILVQNNVIQRANLLVYKTKHWDIAGPPEDLLDSTIQSLTSLATNTARGVKGFLKYNSDGIQNAKQSSDISSSARHLGVGFAKGVKSAVYHTAAGTFKVIGLVGDGIRSLPSMVDKNETFAHRPSINSAVEGWEQGRIQFTNGVVEGVMDMVRKPYIQARKDGITGFGKGVMLGSLSLLTKPISGTIDMVYLTGKGIRTAMSNKGKETPKPGEEQETIELPSEVVNEIVQAYEQMVVSRKYCK
jgi:hypothetical protein